MATDFSKLRESKFWNQKIDRFVRVQDINKSGNISRNDFDVMVERYKKLSTSNPQKVEVLMKHHLKAHDRVGLTDESVRLSYDEFKQKLIEDMKNSENWEPLMEAQFNLLDLNDDGVISFDEWKAHYHCMGINQAHARASFDAMDQNSDGKVSKEEFVNFLCEYYLTDENKLGSAILYGPLD